MKTLPSTDVLIIGSGWTGLLMAKELSGRTPLSITILERGRPRMAEYIDGMDELEFFVRMHMMQDPSTDAISLRYSANEHSRPVRQFGAFLPAPASAERANTGERSTRG
jgi:gluconate 2-dehydrogenase alpha chain